MFLGACTCTLPCMHPTDTQIDTHPQANCLQLGFKPDRLCFEAALWTAVPLCFRWNRSSVRIHWHFPPSSPSDNEVFYNSSTKDGWVLDPEKRPCALIRSCQFFCFLERICSWQHIWNGSLGFFILFSWSGGSSSKKDKESTREEHMQESWRNIKWRWLTGPARLCCNCVTGLIWLYGVWGYGWCV